MFKPENSEVEYLSVADITKNFGFASTTIWRWTKENRFPQPLRIGKRWTRWRKSDVEDFINRNQTSWE